MDKFANISAFVAVVETGGFTAAGERLAVAKSVVSRRISQMEKHLGSRLLNRTTRKLVLTETGRHFYEQSARILLDLADAEERVSQETTELAGTIKLTAPLSFSASHLSHALVGFLGEHPTIQINLKLDDSQVNLVEEGVDMAIRIGRLEDSTLISRRLGSIRLVSCASRSYLQQHGEPAHPSDLADHDGLQYTNISYRQQWQYKNTQGETIYGHPKIVFRANNGDILATMATAGLGIVTAPTFVLGKYISERQLIRILGDFPSPSVGLYAVYPPGRLIPKRIRLFSDYLFDYFGDTPYWDKGLDFAPPEESFHYFSSPDT